jgi:hypothetical protein
MKHVLVFIGIASSCGALVTKVTMHDNAIKRHAEISEQQANAISMLATNVQLLQQQGRTTARVQGQIVRKLKMIEEAVTDDEG